MEFVYGGSWVMKVSEIAYSVKIYFNDTVFYHLW